MMVPDIESWLGDRFCALIDDMMTVHCRGASKTFKRCGHLKNQLRCRLPPLQKHSQTLSENACNGASFLLLTTLYSDATSAPHKSD